jgi:hypothetical protein
MRNWGTSGFAVASVMMLVASFYLLALRPFEARWWHRRRFRLRPDADAQLEYALSDDGISGQAEGLAESRSAWAAVFKVLRVFFRLGARGCLGGLIPSSGGSPRRDPNI